ncbi:MAG: acetylornithine deacetylase [Gammaproteobacteria bacterium]|nr:acetylornithine deacetylase [Gammaproteobacteria bacterium]
MPEKFNDLFNRLLSEHSVSSTNLDIDQSNLGVINLLAETFESLGFTCELVPVPFDGDGEHEKSNLIATLGSGPGGLVLSGHTDTVPFDEALWDTNPLAMIEKDNKLFGLGATDMKGFFAVVHEAIQDFIEADLKQPLIIIATADEESSMAGARTLASLGKPKARAAVIGEPTSLRPIHMHKGIMMESIHVQGQSGHSSNSALGRNALDAMHEVITALMQFRLQLQSKYNNPHFDIDVPTINLGVIHGGDNPNRICGHCDLEFDVRLLPGMGGEAIRESIEAIVAPIATSHNVEINLTSLIPGVDPFDNADSELAKKIEVLTGHTPESVAFGTEGPFLQKLGMDTIIMGPGSIDQAHQPNEYMELSQVKPCIEILKKLIRDYCC